jgi:hypothetical protein
VSDIYLILLISAFFLSKLYELKTLCTILMRCILKMISFILVVVIVEEILSPYSLFSTFFYVVKEI